MIDSKAELRKRAEEKVAHLSKNSEALLPEEIRQTLHELRTHAIELEMQNDELRLKHADLEKELKRYCDLYDMAPVGYCTISEKEFIVEANFTAAALFGMEKKALVGRKITLFIHREDKDIYYLHRKKLFETGEPQVCEFRMVKQDGTSLFHAHIEATAGQDKDASKVCYVVISDITKEKRLQEQLHQAEKMESVARLAGGVAHGFNNMLSVILGYTDMAMEKVDLSNPLFNDLTEIRKAAVCSADLTSQLLTFARRQPIAPIPIDLNQTIESMLTMLHNLIGKDIKLIWKPGLSIWPVKMDTLQIDQMLAQLCVNARNSITNSVWWSKREVNGDCAGKITIETMTKTFDESWCSEHSGSVAGDYVVITVDDNGRGFDTKTRVNIFEPFSTSINVGSFTGLELATVHGIVKQNKGFIKVYSEPEKKTAFTIYLPRYVENTQQVEKIESSTKPATRGNETVLLVEDEPMIMRMGEVILQSLGYKVLAAGSPEDAIRLAEKHSGEFDLLMTDVVMPGINGMEVAKKILSIYPHVRCLFMSGYPADMLNHNGILDEGIYFIKKPFSRRELADRIRQVLVTESGTGRF
ncbi:MAG: response regulator [Desulfamplus sp.]|nr:response regulator [Desulfamplus sp.]